MSRRVFDVGLDMAHMGRLRNGLKHNKDGKETKRSKSYKSSHSKGDALTDDEGLSHEQDRALVPHVKHKKSSPTITPRENRQTPNQPSDDMVLPPSHTNEGPDSGFPLPPSNRASPGEHGNGMNGSAERSVHPSQFYITPSRSQKPDLDRKNSSDHAQNFDLKPPPPNTKVKHIDTLSLQLFSGEHLNVILKDPNFFLRFTAFLNRYKPQSAPVLVRYLEAQKAMKAIEYANALAETMRPAPGEHSSLCPAASVDPRFEARSKRSFDSLVTDCLPAYITNSLTKVVTESMVREITGTGMPVMRELVGGLAEVFCLADPSIQDCPIVYASEEFYRTTRYTRDDVLGRNCRFLQGPKTDKTTIARLRAAINSGQESCETVLNYRRDGSPFMNLLLTAPLYDNKGAIRYFIGAQIDVSGLIDEGRGLDSFERLLAESRPRRNRDSDQSNESSAQKHMNSLREFGQMLSLDESSLLERPHSRASSVHDNASSYRGTPNRPERMRQPRRVLGNEDEGERRDEWTLSSRGPSGKLPGVYQNYLLVRPYPSLRIIFVSPALRIPGLLQSPFLSRIGGSAHVRDGLSDAFQAGAAVTAKVTWLANGRTSEDAGDGMNEDSRPGSRRGGPPSDNGQRTRYISCTPLLGSDDQVGVWMVVMVENELVTGSLTSRTAALARYDMPIPPTPSEHQRESVSMDGDFNTGGGHAKFERTNSQYVRDQRRGKNGSEGGRLYADFMRNGGSMKTNMENGPDREDYMASGMNGGINGGIEGLVTGIKEVQIIQWFVEPEARVEQFDKICEVQSDKASTEITSRFDGVIKKLHYEAEDVAQVGKPLCDIDVQSEISPEDEAVLASSAEQAGEPSDPQQPQKAAEQYLQREESQRTSQEGTDAVFKGESSALATPAVRGLLKEQGVSIADVRGTGRDGRVLKEDIYSFVAGRESQFSRPPQPSQPSTAPQDPNADQAQVEKTITLTPIQSQMFKTMTRSLSIPHFLYADEVDLTPLTMLRRRMNAQPINGQKFSFLHLMIKAVSLALEDFPLLNARVEAGGDGQAPKLIIREKHNIGIAMDTPQGLLVPNIKNVGTKSVVDIAAECNRLQALAKDGKLSVTDLSGGTITVSNIGSIGGTYVAPVLVQSEVAILGIGKARTIPAFDDQDRVIKKDVINFSWSADHRVVDGATMARMGERVRTFVEEPGMMMARLR